jgi:hypothetical protein
MDTQDILETNKNRNAKNKKFANLFWGGPAICILERDLPAPPGITTNSTENIYDQITIPRA